MAERVPFSGETAPAALAANVGLVHAMGLFPTTTWNVPSWRISVESYTYLLFAALVLALGRRFSGLRRRWCRCVC